MSGDNLKVLNWKTLRARVERLGFLGGRVAQRLVATWRDARLVAAQNGVSTSVFWVI